MAKKKRTKRSKRSKTNLLPLLAIGAGLWLLSRQKSVVIAPPKPQPGQTFPGQNSTTSVQRVNKLPIYL